MARRRWGANNNGTIFELPTGSGAIVTLASFNSNNGAQPEGGLLMDSAGNLYGTTSLGGLGDDGTIFEFAKGSGTITTLAYFNDSRGAYPEAGLVMDSAGISTGPLGRAAPLATAPFSSCPREAAQSLFWRPSMAEMAPIPLPA